MNNLGFEFYDQVPGTAKPTTQELIAALSDGNRTAILEGFVKRVDPDDLAHNIFENHQVIDFLYRKMKEIRNHAKARMRGEILIEEAIRDAEGVITTPAVYNIPPTTSGALVTQVEGDMESEFTNTQVTAILTKMVQHSRYDGSGTWSFFRTEVIK